MDGSGWRHGEPHPLLARRKVEGLAFSRPVEALPATNGGKNSRKKCSKLAEVTTNGIKNTVIYCSLTCALLQIHTARKLAAHMGSEPEQLFSLLANKPAGPIHCECSLPGFPKRQLRTFESQVRTPTDGGMPK